jgi:hypothetical protein
LVGEIRKRVGASGSSWHLIPRMAGRGCERPGINFDDTKFNTLWGV